MDTSIIVVIAIIVVFAVAVPAMIRKSATELSRAEIDTVPDNAAVVAAETPNPGHDHSERTQVFHDKPRKTPSVPTPQVSAGKDAPTLSLSASTPAFAVIDGQGQSHTVTEAAEHSQLNVLPIAVGETHSAFSADHASPGHESAGTGGGADNVRQLHPAVHAVFNDSTRGTGHQTGAGDTPQAHPSQASPRSRTAASTTGPRPATGPGSLGGAPRDRGAGTGRGGHLGEGEPTTTKNGPQISNPNNGTDEEHAMTEQATTLRESLKSLNTMVKGFAVVFLASVLGILVSAVLALFSVVHIALAGVFLGLAVVSLFIVRTLNLRKLEVKKRLRHLTPVARSARDARPKAVTPQSTTAPTQHAAPAQHTSSTQHASVAKDSVVKAPVAKTSKPVVKEQVSDAQAPVSSGTAARIAAAAQGASGSTKAAQARAAMARSAEAKKPVDTEMQKAREEADTGEIPLVRIRKEASEGHTTRQVLLTGPIPVVQETTSTEETASTDAAEESDRESAAPAQTVSAQADSTVTAAAGSTAAEESAQDDSAATAPGSLGADLIADADESTTGGETAVDTEADVHAALDAAAPQVDDPFMQRLKSRDGWSPTPLPVPSYVDAPEAEHEVPAATAADASSYETEARSREDIAAEFAAELGYRAELSDSAREDSPLEHGRKAIRTTKAADLGAVNDVLARRRA